MYGNKTIGQTLRSGILQHNALLDVIPDNYRNQKYRSLSRRTCCRRAIGRKNNARTSKRQNVALPLRPDY